MQAEFARLTFREKTVKMCALRAWSIPSFHCSGPDSRWVLELISQLQAGHLGTLHLKISAKGIFHGRILR
jgi:hypothetical protein